MKQNQSTKGHGVAHLETPQMFKGEALHIAGLRRRIDCSTAQDITEIWQEFAPHIGKIPHQIGKVAYGLCFKTSEKEQDIDYMAGVAVSEFASIPANWNRVDIPAQNYAAFSHPGHVSQLRETISAIFESWLPESGQKLAAGGPELPAFFEWYGEEFDPESGMGDIEVWVPIQAGDKK